ncbi:MAG: hypothetical protein WKF92_02245 [Pyrinomonadaceae bacterium]
MIYKNEKNREIKSEVLNSDEQKIAGMIGNLKRIEAPKDFDYRLKARIANANPASYRPAAFFPILRYVMPLGLFLLVGGALMWNGGMNIDNESVPSVAETVQPFVRPVEGRPEANISRPDEIGTAAVVPQMIDTSEPRIEQAAIRKGKTSLGKIERISATSRTSSVDMALKQAPKTILPRGFDSEATTINNTIPNSGIPRQFTAGEILSTIGIKAKFQGKGWKVGSVAKGSLADSSGIQPGDSIEAIDGEALGDKKVFTGGFNAKKIRVVRDSKDLEINLKP